jgi:hypothetical protein
MDSTIETKKHIKQVEENITKIVKELVSRAVEHDKSKLSGIEKEAFDEYTPKLKSSTYGSPEYKEMLKAIQPALDHHYSKNSHHPEHWKNGIAGMDIVDIVELLCDWAGAVKRHNDGNLNKSIKINQERFGYSDDLKSIFENSVKYFQDK